VSISIGEYAGKKVVWVKVSKNETVENVWCTKADYAGVKAVCRARDTEPNAIFAGEPRDHGDYFSVPCYFSSEDRLVAEPEFVRQMRRDPQ